MSTKDIRDARNKTAEHVNQYFLLLTYENGDLLSYADIQKQFFKQYITYTPILQYRDLLPLQTDLFLFHLHSHLCCS